MGTTSDVGQVDLFLSDYSKFLDQKHDSRLRQFRLGFGHLSTALQSMFTMKSEFERCVAPAFNVFHVLDVAHLEVRTHSRFLAALLDPAGTHGQSTLFLDSFLQRDPVGFDEQTIRTGKWEVEREKNTHLGNLDIVISNLLAGAVVVIENKIYAADQKDQLERYDRWLKNHRQFNNPQLKRLLYLTLDGRPSPEDPGKAKGGQVDYQPISYEIHIASWLNGTLPHIAPSHLVSILRQYVSAISTL